MPGSIQKHTLVYTVVLGVILTAFFDLSRIAALGGFVWVKLNTDPLVIGVAVVTMIVICGRRADLSEESRRVEPPEGAHDHHHH